MLLSSQNIDYNSANKFKCLLNSESPDVLLRKTPVYISVLAAAYDILSIDQFLRAELSARYQCM